MSHNPRKDVFFVVVVVVVVVIVFVVVVVLNADVVVYAT